VALSLREWWCCDTALSLSSLYSPVAAVKVVLPRDLHLDRRACGESRSSRARGRSSSRDYNSHLFVPMSRNILFDVEVDKEIETGMNLAALRYDLKLCREHGTYVDMKTLASAIHHVLEDDTEELVHELSAYATGKRE
jgi:hypothetical protein